jgi:hypothetical protein
MVADPCVIPQQQSAPGFTQKFSFDGEKRFWRGDACKTGEEFGE